MSKVQMTKLPDDVDCRLTAVRHAGVLQAPVGCELTSSVAEGKPHHTSFITCRYLPSYWTGYVAYCIILLDDRDTTGIDTPLDAPH